MGSIENFSYAYPFGPKCYGLLFGFLLGSALPVVPSRDRSLRRLRLPMRSFSCLRWAWGVVDAGEFTKNRR
ncbi:MAG: hypothetical protein M2R45_03115 [Verrucomicrobia subdivision 3 bacterium]|nr:hypothetical protein [Limisphaerales bacterium]MCS1413183.1 hypothetical protein [Limisphaerales bacterium]